MKLVIFTGNGESILIDEFDEEVILPQCNTEKKTLNNNILISFLLTALTTLKREKVFPGFRMITHFIYFLLLPRCLLEEEAEFSSP